MERGRSRAYRVFLLVCCIAAGITVGCAPPIGSVGSSGGGAEDLLWTVPKRIVYNVGDEFDRNNDLQVFTSYRGVVEPVPIDQVEISIFEIGIIEAPELPDPVPIPVNVNYPLKTKGRNLIEVEYEGMPARYSIDVRDPLGLGTGPGDGSGIIVEWETPVGINK